MRYSFEWDSVKAIRNLKKHVVSFENAATVFLDPHALTLFDTEHSRSKEDRWITLGVDQKGGLVIVCHTFWGKTDSSCKVRIFSARKTTKSEAKQYKDSTT